VTQGGHISTEPRINERIRVPEVRLVGPAGEQVGIVAINDALLLAQEADLDLVEVAPTARPPVCKLMDYGKFKYESALKARESRKNQAQTVIKEIKLRPKIDPHDYGTKKGHVERFLKAGDKVKVTIMFRGREQSRPELGYRLLQRLAADVEELGFVEAQPKLDGRNMIMVIGPHKRKTGPQHEPRAERVPTRASARAARDSGASADSEHEPAAAPAAAAQDPFVRAPAATPEPVAETPAPQAAPRPAAAPSRPAPASRPQGPAAAPRPATPRPAPSAPRPSTPRPQQPSAAPRPSAPRTAQPGPRPAPAAPRPGPTPSAPRPAAPRPTAPRSGQAAARPAQPGPRPGPAPAATADRGADAKPGR
jgi:translation initiation factor IF-3